MLKLSALFICLNLCISIGAKDRHFKEFSNQNYNVSKKDIYTSKLILEIYKALKGHNLNDQKLKSTMLRSKNSELLKEFFPVLQNLYSLERNKSSLAKTIESCQFDSSYTDVVNVVVKRARHYCHRNFWSIILKRKKFDKLGRLSQKYIEKNIKDFLKKPSDHYLLTYLKKIKKNSAIHVTLSNMIKETYSNHDIKFNQDLISLINIDSTFTSYVQTKGINKKEERYLFNREFHQIKRKIYRDIQNSEFKEAKQNTYQLLDFHKQNINLISAKASYVSLLNIAKKFYRNGAFPISNEINFYVFKNSDGYIKDEAAFGAIFNFIIQNQFNNAVETVNKLSLLKDFEKLSSKLQYWIAYSVSKYGQAEMAKILFSKLIKTNPLSFYSIVALKEHTKGASPENNLVLKTKNLNRQTASIDENISNDIKRLRLWLKSDHRKFVLSEIDNIFKGLKENQNMDETTRRVVIGKLADIINEEDRYLYTFQLIHNSIENNHIGLEDKFLKYLFPRPYLGKIKKHNRGIDPYLILSLIRQESAFNPNAKSRVGARGLMQLMPATARQFKRRLKTKHLRRPDLNLNIGIKYFKRLLKKYDGNLIYTLASYNAGEGNLKKWTSNIFVNPDPLITIEMIPFRETRKYVKLIYRNFYFYKYLTNEEDFLKTALNESFIIKS